MLHPAVLKAELQGAHIPCRDQVPWFHAEIRTDLLDPATVVQLNPDSTGGAEPQVVGTKGGSCESQTQADGVGQLQKGLPPGCCVRFVGIDAEMVCLIGDRHAGACAPFLKTCSQRVALTTRTLIRHQKTVCSKALFRRAGPLLQPQAETSSG